MATRDLTRRFAELRLLRHGIVGESKRAGDSFSESGLLDVSHMVSLHSTVFGYMELEQRHVEHQINITDSTCFLQ